MRGNHARAAYLLYDECAGRGEFQPRSPRPLSSSKHPAVYHDTLSINNKCLRLRGAASLPAIGLSMEAVVCIDDDPTEQPNPNDPAEVERRTKRN